MWKSENLAVVFSLAQLTNECGDSGVWRCFYKFENSFFQIAQKVRAAAIGDRWKNASESSRLESRYRKRALKSSSSEKNRGAVLANRSWPLGLPLPTCRLQNHQLQQLQEPRRRCRRRQKMAIEIVLRELFGCVAHRARRKTEDPRKMAAILIQRISASGLTAVESRYCCFLVKSHFVQGTESCPILRNKSVNCLRRSKTQFSGIFVAKLFANRPKKKCQLSLLFPCF